MSLPFQAIFHCGPSLDFLFLGSLLLLPIILLYFPQKVLPWIGKGLQDMMTADMCAVLADNGVADLKGGDGATHNANGGNANITNGSTTGGRQNNASRNAGTSNGSDANRNVDPTADPTCIEILNNFLTPIMVHALEEVFPGALMAAALNPKVIDVTPDLAMPMKSEKRIESVFVDMLAEPKFVEGVTELVK
jgi:hypothetical protein